MTDLDLDAIKADLAEVARVWAVLHDQTAMGEQSEIIALVQTGSALVAEVERQAALLARVKEIAMGDGDPMDAVPPYWRIRFATAFAESALESSDSSSTGSEL